MSGLAWLGCAPAAGGGACIAACRRPARSTNGEGESLPACLPIKKTKQTSPAPDQPVSHLHGRRLQRAQHSGAVQRVARHDLPVVKHGQAEGLALQHGRQAGRQGGRAPRKTMV